MKDPEKIEHLISKCKKQDSHAQMEIYKLYYKAMFNISYRIVNDFDDAEDVMQEAFIKAFRKIKSFDGKSTFGAWLKRIVINESLTWIRKQKNRYLTNGEIPDVETEEESPECDLNQIKAQKVMEAMLKLNDRYRIALNLHLIEGYDYEELQEILGLSYGNIRTLISRAKTKLKKILKQEYGITQF